MCAVVGGGRRRWREGRKERVREARREGGMEDRSHGAASRRTHVIRGWLRRCWDDTGAGCWIQYRLGLGEFLAAGEKVNTAAQARSGPQALTLLGFSPDSV